MNSQIPPTSGGAQIGPADVSLPTTQPIDLTALLAAQADTDPNG